MGAMTTNMHRTAMTAAEFEEAVKKKGGSTYLSWAIQRSLSHIAKKLLMNPF